MRKVDLANVEISIGTRLKAFFGCMYAPTDDDWEIVDYLQYLGKGKWAIINRNGSLSGREFQTAYRETELPNIEAVDLPISEDTAIECRSGNIYMMSVLLNERRKATYLVYHKEGLWTLKMSERLFKKHIRTRMGEE